MECAVDVVEAHLRAEDVKQGGCDGLCRRWKRGCSNWLGRPEHVSEIQQGYHGHDLIAKPYHRDLGILPLTDPDEGLRLIYM